MISYKDKTFCISDVKVHTCGREFTKDMEEDCKKWSYKLTGKDGIMLISAAKFCKEEK